MNRPQGCGRDRGPGSWVVDLSTPSTGRPGWSREGPSVCLRPSSFTGETRVRRRVPRPRPPRTSGDRGTSLPDHRLRDTVLLSVPLGSSRSRCRVEGPGRFRTWTRRKDPCGHGGGPGVIRHHKCVTCDERLTPLTPGPPGGSNLSSPFRFGPGDGAPDWGGGVVTGLPRFLDQG